MKIQCNCGEYVNTDNDFYKITKYENRPVIKRKSFNNQRITREIVFSYICPKCGKQIVDIHRYGINALGASKKLEYQQLRGLDAEEYLKASYYNRKEREIMPKVPVYSGKGIPVSYFRSVDSTHQRRRYINEAAYDGAKIESKVKVYT